MAIFGTVVPGETFGFRNRIINGDMRIDQRNAGASVTTGVLQGGIYTLDRWLYYNDVVSKRTIQQSSTAPAGFTNSMLVTVIATDIVGPQQFIRQAIEGFNASDFGWGTANAKTVTLSFWVRSSVTGQMGGVLQNSAANRSYPFAYTINSANTFEYKTVEIEGETTGTWLTTNGIGVNVTFENGPGFNAQAAGSWANTNCSTSTGSVNLCATNGATWYITGVQLEVGSVATPFERRPYGTELSLCQRYFYKLASGTEEVITNGCYNASTQAQGAVRFPVTMRAAPTLSQTTGTNYYRFDRSNSVDYLNSWTLYVPSINSTLIYNNTEASGTSGDAGQFFTSNASAFLGFSAEL